VTTRMFGNLNAIQRRGAYVVESGGKSAAVT